MTTLTNRQLNRTLLARQLLDRRTTRSALEVVEHLVAMQSQEPNWPYVGLWTRIDGFAHEQLTALLADRSVVRSTMLRRTQHLAAGADFAWLRPTIQPIVSSALRHPFFADEIDGLDLDKLAGLGRELLAGKTLTRREFAKLLAEHHPDRHAGRLANTVELCVALVHPDHGGTWGNWGTRASMPVALADEWLGRPMAPEPRPELMVERYLAAFGPATVADVQAWAGITRLREVVNGMRLRVLSDESGRTLVDLPDAPLATGDEPAPVRFLPGYDNVVLGHADRTRIISDEDRRRVITASVVRPTFLVDGYVRGVWELSDGEAGAELRIRPYRPLADDDAEAVLAEARHLLAFVAPGGSPVILEA